MTIRPETPDDRDAIHAVHALSFPSTIEARLVDALRDAGRLVVSLVAELQGEVVGHVAFSPVNLTNTDDGVGLGPVAVRPTARRRGIAEALIRAGCTESNAGFVVVLGEPAYYRRFGFSPASRFNLSDEYGGGDAFQVLELRRGAIPSGGGVVRYASEFDAFDEGGSE